MRPEIECPHTEDAKQNSGICPFADHCSCDCKYQGGEKMNHYRIRYCDLDGKEVPVYQASLYRVFLHGKFIREFNYLSAANEWITANTKEEKK